jgi:hypothetical protein
MTSNQSSQRTSHNAPIGSVVAYDDFWTFDAVEERLIEAMRLWWRSPGGGTWPFAADAPWHLMTRRTRVEAGGLKGRELQLHMQAEDADETRRWQGRERPGPLTRDEVGMRDEATEWLGFVPARDRKLVILVLVQKAAGRTVSWLKLKPLMGVEFGADGLRKRYSRAVSGVTQRLNSEPSQSEA